MDEAADRPNASIDVLADVVPGASVELVERVLDEYGDPADESGDTQHEGDDDGGTTVPALEELSEKQRETIHAIQAHPDATQRELGKILDVTAATISQRVGGIPDFEWSDRAAYANAILETAKSTDATTQEPSAQESASDTDTTDSGGAQDDEDRGTEEAVEGANTGADVTEDADTRPTADDDATAEADADVDTDSMSAGAAPASAGQPTSDTITIALGGPDRDAGTAQDASASMESATGTDGQTATATDGQPATVTDGNGASAPNRQTATASDGGTVRAQEPVDVDRLMDRISSLESALESLHDRDAQEESERGGVLADPDLVAKVVRACMSDDAIDESEERDIIAALMD